MEGRSFPGAFERREKLLYLGKFLQEFERYVKKALQTDSSVHRGPVGELGGGSFTGPFERKRECISGFFFLGPRGHSGLSPGAIWNFSKEQGSPELISDYGAQRACL